MDSLRVQDWIVAVILAFLVGQALTRPRFARQASLEGIEDPEAARAYDRVSRTPQFRLIRRMVARELRRLKPESPIVDVGCGPGYLVAVLAREFPDEQIIGVDLSEEMTQVAAANMAALGLGRTRFVRGDAAGLPFADGSVGFIVSTLSLHHWSDPAAVFREFHRALKPGGRFLVFDVRRDALNLFYWLFAFARRVFLPKGLRRLNEPTGSALASYVPSEIEEMMEASPFTEWMVRRGAFWTMTIGRK